jgi:PilZ domain-containing protein
MAADTIDAQPQNHRIANRYRLPAGALASFNLHSATSHPASAQEGEAKLVDLSIAGCKLQSDSALATSIYYSLILHLPTYPRPINVTSATIRWVDACTFGVRFTHLDIADVEHLHTFLVKLHTEEYGLIR